METLILRKLPQDWVHPMGIAMGGYWGTYVNGRLMHVDRHLEEAKRVLDECKLKYEVNGNA